MSETARTKTKGTSSTNGAEKAKVNGGRRVIADPNEVASVVLLQIDEINAKKDDLTIAIKQLTDTTKQLVRAYANHSNALAKLQKRVAELEAKQS